MLAMDITQWVFQPETELRLGAQSVTLLSTLRDPTQLKKGQCANTHQHPFFYGSS